MVRDPASHLHEPTDDVDGMLQFCSKCGRLLAIRQARNSPWTQTGAASRRCDWGG